MTRLNPEALAVTSFETSPAPRAATMADTDGCISPLCVTDGPCTTPWCDPTQPAGG